MPCIPQEKTTTRNGASPLKLYIDIYTGSLSQTRFLAPPGSKGHLPEKYGSVFFHLDGELLAVKDQFYKSLRCYLDNVRSILFQCIVEYNKLRTKN